MDLNNPFDRVRNETPPYVNARIDKYIQGSIQHYSGQDRDSVLKRIFELDREWDIDRALMLNFAVVGGTTFTAGVKGNRKWLYFLAVQMLFLGLHALKGWCPPVSLFRRMGFRTRYEIEYEKAALLDILKKKDTE
ncbi:MAG: hypothetical protein ABFD50_23410 [Smithella sp.]